MLGRRSGVESTGKRDGAGWGEGAEVLRRRGGCGGWE